MVAARAQDGKGKMRRAGPQEDAQTKNVGSPGSGLQDKHSGCHQLLPKVSIRARSINRRTAELVVATSRPVALVNWTAATPPHPPGRTGKSV